MLPQLQGKIAGCVAFLLLILQQHDMHHVSTLGDSLCVCLAPALHLCLYMLCKGTCVVWKRLPLSNTKKAFSPSSPLFASFSMYVCISFAWSLCEVYRASRTSDGHKHDKHSYKHCMQAETAGFGADNLNVSTILSNKVANTADAHGRFCENSTRTLLFRSYRFATRMPSTRCRRHATSPATSAVAMRCFTIMSDHQSDLPQTAACSNSTRADMSS